MQFITPATALLALAGLTARADPSTSVPSATRNPTTAQQTRDALDPPRSPAEAAGRGATARRTLAARKG